MWENRGWENKGQEVPASPGQECLRVPRVEFSVGIDLVIFSVDHDQNCLLVLLGRSPQARGWALPGSGVGPGESLQAAAYRIVSETIQVQNLYLEQLYSFDEPLRSQPSESRRYLSVSYFALVRYEEAPLRSESVAWHVLNSPIQFQAHHQEIVQYGYQRLRNKVAYSPIAFDVLPVQFTLHDLYQFYCAILGDGFADYSNFRSKLLKLGFLRDTGEKLIRGAGRPASLFQFDREAFAPFQDQPLVFV